MTSCRILLVDDHLDTLSVLARLLKSAGHEACVAATAEAALQRLAAQSFDILLIDLGLPDQDGRELLKSVRLVSDAPAIVLTGFGNECDVDSCKAAGFARHLVKPIAFDQLLSTLEEVVPLIPSGCGAVSDSRHIQPS